jgi:alpha-glucan,water dikinase
MHLDLRSASDTDAGGALRSTQVRELADEIVGEEMGRSSWTLMHRFNLCHDLLDGAENSAEALALLYTWLRYSALRQLDWQRHYNTKPRELSHAQDRLTTRLGAAYRDHPVSRPWVRLMLTTLGPGGEGQRVRDEILNIMHRHKIKEVHGHFMEEWHQKLHNNTTPDDVVICEAYLAFLNSDGDLAQFYNTLENSGVTRARLASFERPIKTDPWFHGDKKQGLIWDFEHFLGILKSVHSGTDLASAVATARDRLDGSMNQRLDRLLSGQDKSAPVLAQVEQITAIREPLQARIGEWSDVHGLRDLLYLDLALEQTLRGILEQQALRQAEVGALASLTLANLDNLRLSVDDPEFLLAAHQLYTLVASPNASADWALRVKSVTDRVGRVIGEWSNQLYEMLQPKAEFMGKAFDVEHWTIPLFSEEVIRGSPPFVLSLLLRRLDPLLRAQAGLGGWQVISPAQAAGRVEVVESLLSVQGERYGEPTLLVTDKVSGEEEIPSGVTSIITSDTPDLVSHVAVRARNAQVLFASCYDAEPYHQIKHLQGERLTLQVSPSGDVKFAEFEKAQGTSEPLAPRTKLAIRRRRFSTWALGSDEFDDERVGGKSNNLNALRGRLSDWVHFPASMALPFGVFEESLRSRENQALAQQYESLLGVVDEDPAQHLPALRDLPLKLASPAPLQQALANAWTSTGLPAMEEESVWRAIARVWGSKWNDRAYYSRTAHGIAHEDLMIAVLIQRVVEADYAFVIHSVNPMTGNKDEVFAEVVLGMGETLVGNYPGRALGFLCHKSDLKLSVLSYPSKSKGLYGSGVIFRSDSNGEDLEGFAGAGLYDSFLAEPPHQQLLDYTHEPLINDQSFAQALMVRIAQLAIEVEQTFGSPQDIEGAVQKGEYYIVQSRPQVGLEEKQ